jgi:hypothetical protein
MAANTDKIALESAVSALDRLGEQVNLVKGSKLSRITGIPGALPNIPGSQGSDAQARLDALKSQVGFSVLQALRNSAKTGSSGLGQVTQKEHELLQSQLGSLAKAQSEGEIRRVLGDISKFVEESKDRLRAAHESKHSGQTSPASSSTNKPYALKNSKGWSLMRDPVSGVRAYVGPNGQYEVVP